MGRERSGQSAGFEKRIQPAGFGKIFSAGGIRKNIFGRRDSEKYFWAAGGIQKNVFGRRDSETYFRPASQIRKTIFGRTFRSRAQIQVQVVTINSVQESSKLELFSGTFDPVKVFDALPKTLGW